MRWPDIEKALTAGLRAEAIADRVGTKVPDNIEQLSQFVRIARGPGSDDSITDSPLIDVECFAQDYGAASALAEDIRQYLHSLTGHRVGGVLIDRVTTATGPTYLDYGNPGTNRFVASYRLEYRQH